VDRGTTGGGFFRWLGFSVALLTSCAGGGPLAPDGEQEWASVAPADDGKGAPGGNRAAEPAKTSAPLVRRAPDEFVVLDAGREPRSAVRYRYRAGESSTVRLRMNLSIAMLVQGRRMRLGLPTQMDVQSATLQVDAAGNARRLHRFTRASLFDLNTSGFSPSADMRKFAEDFTSRVEHMAIEEVVDARGAVVETTARFSEDADPMLRQSIGDLQDALGESTVPFPEQPIGVGARWLRKNKMLEGGVSYDQEVVTTLTALDGARAETTVELVQRAPRQEYALPNGTLAEIEVSETTARGTSRVQLTPFAVKAQTQASGRHVMRFGAESLSIETSMSLELSTLGKQL